AILKRKKKAPATLAGKPDNTASAIARYLCFIFAS
ncbi:MAG: hypothetical protein ACI8U1_001328, partial [Rheinheimera aquimaris]